MKEKLYRIAVAALGFVMFGLAIVGVVSLVKLGLDNAAAERAALQQDLTYFIQPLTYYTPSAFETPDDTDQDSLILSAIYRVTEAERIRQLKEKDMQYAFEMDEYSRLLIPVDKITAEYAALYGAKAEPYLHTIGDPETPYSTYAYDEEKGIYAVPIDSSESLYDIFVDKMTVQGDVFVLEVGYVQTANLDVDDRGNYVAPTRKDAQYLQSITVQQTDKGFQILSVADIPA